MTTPFDFIKAVSETKKDLIETAEDEKDYVPWIVNKGLSYFPDTILFCNEMNKLPDLDNKLQFDYYKYSLSTRKRYSKWIKKQDNDDLDAVSQYYGYSMKKAEAALSILNREQIDEIKRILKVIND